MTNAYVRQTTRSPKGGAKIRAAAEDRMNAFLRTTEQAFRDRAAAGGLDYTEMVMFFDSAMGIAGSLIDPIAEDTPFPGESAHHAHARLSRVADLKACFSALVECVENTMPFFKPDSQPVRVIVQAPSVAQTGSIPLMLMMSIEGVVVSLDREDPAASFASVIDRTHALDLHVPRRTFRIAPVAEDSLPAWSSLSVNTWLRNKAISFLREALENGTDTVIQAPDAATAWQRLEIMAKGGRDVVRSCPHILAACTTNVS